MPDIENQIIICYHNSFPWPSNFFQSTYIYLILIHSFDCASKSIIVIMQRYQSKLRIITNAPWYVTNQTFHSDLHIPFVRTVIQDCTHKHRTALVTHPNPLVKPMLHPAHNRRLKRRWTFDTTN
jgi:hypothetical protein